jgi:t-SNARE complex subunit (syntaxin)
LAPLNAISSLDDVEWLSWLKLMSKGIKYGTAAITVSMIVYGIIDLRRRIPKKRVEEFEREKAKAQDLLSQEGKRMFNESSRDWTSAISNWMRETAQLIQAQIDKNIREMQQNKTQQLNNEKQQQQRIQQSVDLFQRNIQTAERHRDQLTQRFRDFVAENEKDLKL